MNQPDVYRLLRFLKANGAWVELDEDAEAVWGYAMRSFTPEMVRAGCLWFLERNHPREVSPATIKAAVVSLIASGRFVQDMCPDHPEEVARHCRGCAADVLAGERPRAAIGKALHPDRVLTSRPQALARLDHIGVVP